MIKGFEDITAPLSEEEIEMIPVFIQGFRKKLGPQNAVKNKDIVKALQPRYGKGISEPRVRKIINHIRNNNLIQGLIATSRGYYISQDPSEIKGYIESLMGREKAIRGIRNEMVKYYVSISGNQ